MGFRSEAVKELRDQQGLTMDAFAHRIGASKQVVSTWETGACEPRVNSVARMAHEFGVPVSFFFTNDETIVVSAQEREHESA